MSPRCLLFRWNLLPTPSTAGMVTFREYFVDWTCKRFMGEISEARSIKGGERLVWGSPFPFR